MGPYSDQTFHGIEFLSVTVRVKLVVDVLEPFLGRFEKLCGCSSGKIQVSCVFRERFLEASPEARGILRYGVNAEGGHGRE